MTPTKSSNSGPRASTRIACYGTAFLADAPFDVVALKRGVAPDVPEFSSPRLDASFLINCGLILTGNVATTETPNNYVERVAGTDFHSPKATHFYKCSTVLSGLLAGLTELRAAEVAAEWYSIHGLAKTKSMRLSGRTQQCWAILQNLVALAKQGRNDKKALMLRAEYRKQR